MSNTESPLEMFKEQAKVTSLSVSITSGWRVGDSVGGFEGHEPLLNCLERKGYRWDTRSGRSTSGKDHFQVG